MRQGVLFLSTALMLLLVAATAIAGNRVPHGPIAITNDHEFTAQNGVCSGSGATDDPYVIENWIIDAGGHDYGILIRGTTRAFVIRNVEISGAAKSAIYFSYVKHGKIMDSTLKGNWTGITLSFSSLIRISGNVLASNGDGLRLYFSSRNQVLENEFSQHDTALWFDASNENTVLRNIFKDGYTGAYLTLGSTENVLAGNAFVDNIRHAYADAVNQWDENQRGNYWCGFRAIDAEGDGIWDVAYAIEGEGNHDGYPLCTHPQVPEEPPATCGG
jgi:parallel beta-helix repeat protein